MDSEFSDTKKLYEVKELQDYDTDSNIQFKVDDTASRKQPQSSAWKIPIVLGLLILSVILLLVVILQSITIAHLNLLPVVCPEEEATTPSVTTDALTSDIWNRQTEVNTELLSQISRIVNMSENILAISDEHYTYSQNNTNWLDQILETTQGSAQKLNEIVQTLSNIKDNGVTTEGVVNDILMVVEELLRLQNDSFIFSSHLPISCLDIKNKQPNSPSGYYHINSQLVYCEMGELCNTTEGGWTRLAYLDMTDSTVDCPSDDFKLYQANGVRACGRSYTYPSCSSIKFPSNGISYSEVCGRVTGYQYQTTDGISANGDIDSHYVDGISITQGSPRQHIWTMIAGLFENHPHSSNCPCNLPSPPLNDLVPPFVGDNYFCESGNSPSNFAWGTIATQDPLWDGKQCGEDEEELCCAATTVPWFYRSLNSTTDYIELRVCGDESNANEDNPISLYEIYVK